MKSTDELILAKKKLDKVSPSFCLAKWKNSTIHLHNGHTQSCHHVRSQKIELEQKNPPSLHNNTFKKMARKKMLLGKRPAECAYCWKVEDQGEISDRVHKSSEPVYMDFFNDVVASETGAQTQPSFLEISFDHICQFRCMYCSPAYSSQWEKEVREFGEYPTIGNLINKNYNKSRNALPAAQREEYIRAFWSWWPELSSELRYIRITGGEPLLSKETFRLINNIINQPKKNLNFAINSNLGVSEQKMDEFCLLIKKLQSATQEVLVFSSIDCVGEQAEYIRYGLNYSNFLQNIKKLLDSTQRPLTLCFMITVNLLSLPGLKDLLQLISQLRAAYPHHKIQLDTPYLRQPEHLSVEILTPDFRSYIKDSLKFVIQDGSFTESEVQKISRITSLVANVELNPAKTFLLRKDFLRFINEYDRRKGTVFAKTFPEYDEFFKLCSSSRKNFQQSFLQKGI